MVMETSNTLKKIGFASFIMMGSVFASRIIGLVRESTIAWVGGAKASVDAYQIAFIIPEILNHIVASGFLSITFIPIFAHYLSQNREEEGFVSFRVDVRLVGYSQFRRNGADLARVQADEHHVVAVGDREIE